jgi:hypothetical protein
MKFVDLVHADPVGRHRFTKATDPFRSIGIHEAEPGRRFLYIFEDGAPVRMLSRREITALLIDIDDNWRIANQ